MLRFNHRASVLESYKEFIIAVPENPALTVVFQGHAACQQKPSLEDALQLYPLYAQRIQFGEDFLAHLAEIDADDLATREPRLSMDDIHQISRDVYEKIAQSQERMMELERYHPALNPHLAPA